MSKLKNRIGKYELGRTVGEGNFAKVKCATNVETGESYAVKIFDKEKVFQHKIVDHVRKLMNNRFLPYNRKKKRTEKSFLYFVTIILLNFVQIKREIHTLKLIEHPNVVRLYEVRCLLRRNYYLQEHTLELDHFI